MATRAPICGISQGQRTSAIRPISGRTRNACSTKRSVIFCDTSALLAFVVPGDQDHARAVASAALIRQRREVLWTIDPVLTELWRLLRSGLGHARADTFVRGWLDGGLQRE